MNVLKRLGLGSIKKMGWDPIFLTNEPQEAQWLSRGFDKEIFKDILMPKECP